MNTWLEIITLTSIALVVYHHAGYPIILRMLRQRRQATKPDAIKRGYQYTTRDDDMPSVAIVIPAYNEAQWIAEKIRNLAVLDYPPKQLQVIIACDGCTDDTASIARSVAQEPACQHLQLECRDFSVNRGKVAIINDVVSTVECDIVALSDVSALISIDALLIAAGHFKDPEVGVLNGYYRLLNPGSEGEQTYWRYQRQIKASEALLGATLGAHGAFYLFRRSLFQPLPVDTINDDFVLPMEIVSKGYRADYIDSINALELEQASDTMDHQRRKRIAAGNLQQLLRLKHLLLPKYKGVAFTFASGKGLRVLVPFLMYTTLIGSILLAAENRFFLRDSLLSIADLRTGRLAGTEKE